MTIGTNIVVKILLQNIFTILDTNSIVMKSVFQVEEYMLTKGVDSRICTKILMRLMSSEDNILHNISCNAEI